MKLVWVLLIAVIALVIACYAFDLRQATVYELKHAIHEHEVKYHGVKP